MLYLLKDICIVMQFVKVLLVYVHDPTCVLQTVRLHCTYMLCDPSCVHMWLGRRRE